MADAGTSVDDRDEGTEGEHGSLPPNSLGLAITMKR